MADDSVTAAGRVRSHRKGRPLRRRQIKGGGELSISSLPDVILQQILSFSPTKSAIRTSLLSRRWRHVWCQTPSLSLDADIVNVASINETLTRYTAPKMIDFHLYTSMKLNVPHFNQWIELAMSRNVENLSLDFWSPCFNDDYKLPDFFYINSSFKQLSLVLQGCDMIPTCSVAWTSLKKLSLRNYRLSDESLAKILSGCPILESLTLSFCNQLKILDLSNSVCLRRLEIDRNVWVPWPMHIEAPHIRCLILKNSRFPFTLVDVSSLTEAKMNIYFSTVETTFQVMALKMVEKLRNAEKLTFGANFLQILSLAEICGLPFPMLNVQDLTLETSITRYVIPGIERLLQNSPDLKKLTIHTRHCNAVPEEYLDTYLDLQGLSPDQCWRSKDGVFWKKSRQNPKSKHVTSFMEVVLKNAKTLEKMVVLLEEGYVKFKKLVRKLSRGNNVSIVLLTNPL